MVGNASGLIAGTPLSALDLIAVAWFLVAFGGYQWASGLPVLEQRSLSGAVQQHRIHWMRNMAKRENRMLDGQVMAQLAQGNAFFASTSAIAIGGLAALLGSGQKLLEVMQRLPFVADATPAAIEVKTLLLMAVFVYAFFKFAWAFRLSHYCGIMIGATPLYDDAPEDEARESHVRALAGLIGIAANHANSGIRSFYYAIAAMAWYFHPLLFMAATTWILLILIRRDFFSRSRRVMRMGIG